MTRMGFETTTAMFKRRKIIHTFNHCDRVLKILPYFILWISVTPNGIIEHRVLHREQVAVRLILRICIQEVNTSNPSDVWCIFFVIRVFIFSVSRQFPLNTALVSLQLRGHLNVRCSTRDISVHVIKGTNISLYISDTSDRGSDAFSWFFSVFSCWKK
jgi:hypothetical protein